MAKINTLDRASAFKLYDYFKAHQALTAQMRFNELVDFARICIPNVSQWTVREFTKQHGVTYKRQRATRTTSDVDKRKQLDRIEAKLDQLLSIWQK